MPVFDCEADGLYPSKFYVLSYFENGGVISLTDQEDMKAWLLNQEILIGHNISRWDIPQLERVLGIKINAQIIDTLALSWYCFPSKKVHGLEMWGVHFGVPKPVIHDWYNQDLEDYIHRCETDVKINFKLWEKERNYLSDLYEVEKEEVENLSLIKYLAFKMDCAREQEESRWKLDIPFCQKALEELGEERQIKVEALSKVMPPVEKLVLRSYPAKPYKKDGSLSVTGAKWRNLILSRGLTEDHREPIYVTSHFEPPNPKSYPQIKDWLFSLGWKPLIFKEEKEDDGSVRKIPQIKKPDEPDLCESVLELQKKEPAIEHLAGLSVLNHRIGILEGFLSNVDEEGYLKARVQGLTNTLRFKHTEIVNLPGEGSPFWEKMRGCLICDEGNLLVGSDKTALEDLTKRHFIYEYDPEYVEEMSIPGYDPHLDLALRGKAIDQESVDFYKTFTKDMGDNAKAEYSRIKVLRHNWKTTNYSATYGVGKYKLSRDLKISVREAEKLLKVYWERNWAILKVAENCRVKEVGGDKWLFNPISKFWYSLRAEKDRFSTLNQGTGVYCFDSWIREIRKRRPQLTAQFHDEIILEIKEGQEEKIKKLLYESLDKVNEKLNLNIKLGIDIKLGKRYSDVH